MYIGVDLGTTACKAVMYDPAGNLQSVYNEEYSLICHDGFVEQDAEMWWTLAREAIKTVAAARGDEKIRGISVSTQSISFVPTDGEGNVLSNAITWLDTRAGEECDAIVSKFGRDYVFRVTGKHAAPDYTLPKLMWLKSHEPEKYNKTVHFMLPLDFLNYRLTGKAVCDYTVAGGTMAYDLQNKCYDKALLEFAEVDERLLPSVGCMGDFVGCVLPDVAEELGINSDCEVYLGGQDQKLAAIGAGIDKDSVTVSLGTATAVTKLTEKVDLTAGFSHFRFNEDYCSYEGVVSTSGAALKWAAGTIFGGLSYKELDRLAIEAGNSGGVTFKPDLTVGGEIHGLTLGTSTGNIVYALYEGVARDIKDFAERMGNSGKLCVFGGGAKSDIWCRVISDVCGKTVCVPEDTETASRGAATLASGMTLPPSRIKKEYRPQDCGKL